MSVYHLKRLAKPLVCGLILCVMAYSAYQFFVPAAKISGAQLVSQEHANSQLIVATCDEVKYQNIDCELYKSLAKELKDIELPEVKYSDIVCLSSAAMSVELPPLTPPWFVNTVVEKVTEENVECDTQESWNEVRKILNDYQRLKTAEKAATVTE
ncbi:TPA: hypothetical protein RQJ95_000017 [Vibrio vulnificus]|nr:hypothetical protein [Vibrio vulnificus]